MFCRLSLGVLSRQESLGVLGLGTWASLTGLDIFASQCSALSAMRLNFVRNIRGVGGPIIRLAGTGYGGWAGHLAKHHLTFNLLALSTTTVRS